MKVMIIATEVRVIEQIDEKLSGYNELEIIGGYLDYTEASNQIKYQNPDVIFLDIDAVNVDGMKFAERILTSEPSIKFVLLASDEDRAVEAFELNALDFITKPILEERLLITINRLLRVEKNKARESLMVCCFRTLHFISTNSSKIMEPKWRTIAAKEIFMYLLHYRGKEIRKDTLIDQLWPDADMKTAYSQLYTTVYTIRKTLEKVEYPITIESTKHTYKLSLNNVKVDVDVWETAINNLPPLSDQTLAEYKEVIGMYKGAYFESEQLLWTDPEKQRLRVVWLGVLQKLSNYLIEKDEPFETILLHLQAIKIDSLYEESYFVLMRLYHEIGDRNSVKMYYDRLKAVLDEELGIEPNQDVQDWYNSWATSQQPLTSSPQEKKKHIYLT